MTCSIAQPALSSASREALELLELVCPEILEEERRVEAEWKFAVRMRLLALSVARELQQDEVAR